MDAAMMDALPRAWAVLGLSAPEGLMQRLLGAWAEPQRHYHSQQHLHECLPAEHHQVAVAERLDRKHGGPAAAAERPERKRTCRPGVQGCLTGGFSFMGMVDSKRGNYLL